LAWAREKWDHDRVYPLIIDYGQRHKIELDCAFSICHIWQTQTPRKLSLDVLRDLGGAALTDDDVDVDSDARKTGNVFAAENNLPSTFVPGRNLLFFTLAAAYGAQLGIYNIVTGVCETDRAGYPDCRGEFVDAAESAMQEALGIYQLAVHAPLLTRSKAETFAWAEELGVLETILEMTNTCYHGHRGRRHDWGYGCNECPACDERRRGWDQYSSEKKELRRLDV
jgi:7-cyano-7-deazaguanine synthase